MNSSLQLTKTQMITLGVFAFIAVAGIYLTWINKPGQQAGLALKGEPSPSPSVDISPSPAESMYQIESKHLVTIKTNFGDIVFETYDADAPKTVENFITLAKKGYYTNLTFHRVVKAFVIQGGDPKGDGTGGPGYEFEDELNPDSLPARQGYKKGVVAMANRGPNTNGSQFFIILQDYPLPYRYTIFGRVIQGQDAVDTIGQVETDEHDNPTQPVIIKQVLITPKSQQLEQ